MTPSAQRRPTADVARGLAAMVLLVAILGGVPWVLLRVLHANPIPQRIPTLSEVWQRLAAPDDGSLLVDVLTVTVWAAWAVVAITTVAEAGGRIAGIRVPRLTGLASVQDGVGALVAAVAVLLPLSPLSAQAGTALAASSHTASGQPQQQRSDQCVEGGKTPADGRTSSAQGARGSEHLPHYTVARHDTLWRIAERYLGDGLRYREIAALNHGRPQPDGSVFVTADAIRPGWILLLPPDATGLPGQQASSAAAPVNEITVHNGNTLWGIAERHYGDGEQFPLIVQANEGRLQPDGHTLTDPDLIRPGWTLTLPAAGHPSNRQQPRTPCRPATTPAVPEQPPRSHDAPRPARTGPPRSAPSGAAGTSTTSPPGRFRNTSHHRSPSLRLVSGGLVGTSLAAAVATAVAQAGRRRLRRYRPGTPGRLHDVPPMPAVVRTLYRAHLALPPGQAHDDAAVAAAVDPLPGPVAVALHNVDGTETEFPVDPVELGGLGLTGPGALDSARALIVTNLARHRSSGIEIVTSRQDLARLLEVDASRGLATPPGNMTVTDSLDDALTHLEVARIARARRREDGPVDDPYTAQEEPPAQPLPTLLLVATPDPATRHRLSAIVRLGAEHGIGAVLLGDWPDGTTYRVDAGGHAALQCSRHAGEDPDVLRFFSLPAADTAHLLELLAEDAPTDPAPDRDTHDIEAPPPPGPATASEARPAAVTVFGPLRLHAKGEEIATGLRDSARRLLLYLAVHPEGATIEEAAEALWPDDDLAKAKESFHAGVRNLRKILRTRTGHQDAAFVVHASGRYLLDPNTVDVDLWRFRRALHRARHVSNDADRVAALRNAAGLYTGELAATQSFDWLEPERERARRDALDTLTALAQLQETDDPEAALGTLEDALIHDPYCDSLYRRVMRLQAQLGRPEAVRRSYQLLEVRLAEIDAEPEPATQRLLHTLLASPPADHAHQDAHTPSCRPAARATH